MRNPIEIEQAYQKLIDEFHNSFSIRLKYRLFQEFISLLDKQYKKYISYIIEFASNLPLLGNSIMWIGIDPTELDDFIRTLQEIKDEDEKLGRDKKLIDLITRLQEVCILLYCCLNELEEVRSRLETVYGLNIKNEHVESNHIESFAWLDTTIQRILEETTYSLPINKKKSLLRMLEDLESFENGNESSVYVPVSETYELSTGERILFGRLRNLSIEIIGKSEKADYLRRNFSVFGAEQQIVIDDEHILNAPRKIAEKIKPKLVDCYYKGIVSYSMTSAMHEGESANLAISALWYSSIINQDPGHTKHLISSKIAITGNIDKNGDVLPIDDRSIDQKLNACFFSPCSIIVVPECQKQLFLESLNLLKRNYPKKTLNVIGVRTFNDLLADRRIVLHQRESVIKYRAKKLWQQKKYYFALVVIVLLSLSIYINFIHPIDKNPVNFKFQGQNLILTNASGLEVARILVDSETVAYQNQGSHIFRKPLVALYDITRDGINDVIWATRGNFGVENYSVVNAYSIQNNDLIWSRELKQNYDFPRIQSDLRVGMQTHEIGIIKIDETDVRLIVSSDARLYFPAVVTSMNIFTGEILSEYLHTGMLFDMKLLDITDNGVKEIILLGVNNAFWNASVVVLDPLKAHGHSPITVDYKPDGIERAEELAYILVPKTVVGEYTQPVDKFNVGASISFDEPSDLLRFNIIEGQRAFRDAEIEAFITLFLNRQLQPMGVGTSDLYDVIARELYEEGNISQIPDYDYFNRFMETILYLNGERFMQYGEIKRRLTAE